MEVVRVCTNQQLTAEVRIINRRADKVDGSEK